jgi:hypothetical protein
MLKPMATAAAVAVSLSACTAHTWAPGPHQSAANFNEVSGRCKLVAMGIDTGDGVAYAQGSPQFVGTFIGASVAAGAIGSAARQQNAYNACMEANGFYAVDTAPGPNAPAAAAVTPAHSSTPVSPSAASAPTVASASTTQVPAARTVPSGERQRIGFFAYLNPDCSFPGYMTVRIIAPPAHGEVTTERGVDYTNYPKENQRYQCNLRQSPVSNVYYKSNPGYLGTDHALIEGASPLGTTTTRFYQITVR